MAFREEVVNVELAKLLCRQGLDASPENVVWHGKLPDVIITIQGVKIILEGKVNNREALLKQTRERIESGLCEISIAVYYDEALRKCGSTDELHDKLLNFKYSGVVFYQGENGIKQIPYNDIGLKDFIQCLSHTIGLIVNADILLKMVNEVQEQIESLVSYSFKNSLWFDDVAVINKLKELLALEDINLSKSKDKKDIIRIAIFVIFDSMIFQESIRNINSSIRSISEAYNPYKQFFEHEWCKILKIDYKSVFAITLDILKALPNGIPDTEEVLKRIRDAALRVINSGILMKHDFMGRIYHKLLLKTTGQYYATYYTAVPSAYLLANLLFRARPWEFQELESLHGFKIIDPACGSGTLLSASYTALRNIYLTKIMFDEFESFHRIMLEEVIHGFDVLSYATHLTLTVLGLHNPRVLINESNIYRLPNGIDTSGKICLGSISLLEIQHEFPVEGVHQPGVVEKMDYLENSYYPYKLEMGTFDVVIMNPPFSRGAKPNTKFGYTDEIVKDKMNKKLKDILIGRCLSGIGTAGLGAVFIMLGHYMLKKKGRIGIVIPRSTLSGVSTQKIRNTLLKEYEIKYIISNHDAGDSNKGVEPWNWSEDTKLGEIMIVAEKTDKSMEDREVVYVNVWNKPENEIDSLFYSHQVLNKKLTGYITDGIYNNIEGRNKTVGTFYKIKQNELTENWLKPCLFASPSLNNLVLSLPRVFPVCKLWELITNNGADIKQIKDAFKEDNSYTPFKIVFGQQSNMNTLKLEDIFIKNASAKTSNANRIYDKGKASFLLAERPHLGNDCLIAMKTSHDVLATAFWELRFANSQIEPLMLLWFNSTPGLLMYLSSSTSSMGEIFKTKKEQLKIMDVLDPRKCSDELIQRACKFYEENKLQRFEKFKYEFDLAAHGSGLRYMIDNFFIGELGIGLDLRCYYEMLTIEPSLTKKRLIVP